MEKWLPIPGYEGIYEVSDKGGIRSLQRIVNGPRGKRIWPAKNIKPTKDFAGYSYFSVVKDGKIKKMKVHRAVSLAFIPNPDNKPCVNHKDAVKDNNAVTNLEWVTYQENSQHALDNGLLVAKSSWECPLSKQVQLTFPNGKAEHFGSLKDAEMYTGIWGEAIAKSARKGNPIRKGKGKGVIANFI